MKSLTRTIATLSATFLFATSLAGLSAPANAQANSTGEVTLTVTELPGQVRLMPGEKIDLTLQTNRTTGYQWSASTTGKKKAIKVSKGEYTPSASALAGAPGTTTWMITARKPGTAKVKISATPPGGGDPDISTLTVIVMKESCEE
ncbi:MAG: hypothetical protein GKR85_09515 [Candidatus Nanopelagicales bacterium]|nr:hypothetical protein [Candidatus Nanopelagicales bacterium]